MALHSRDGGWHAVPDLLVTCAAHRPDVPLLAEPAGSSVTAAALLQQALRGAEALRRLGVGHGSVVALDTASLTWSEVATAYFSVVWLGAVAAMVLDDETERLAVETVDATVLITVDSRRRDRVRQCAPADLAAAPAFAGPPAARPDDRLDLVFTSGTTGKPKPVASTHAQWTGAVRPEIVMSRARRVVAHTGVPVGVSGGLHGILLNHVARGVTSVRARTAADMLAACREREVHELHLTPHAARALIRLVGDTERATHAVKTIRVVGGPVPAIVAEGLSACFPRARVVSLYGLTEGGPAVFVKVVDNKAGDRGDLDSIGRPMRGSEVRVLDAEGRDVQAGQVGELAVRATAAKPLAYVRDDALNQTWFQDGWARTGDVGFVDGSGAVRLVGRVKELIFLRGGRISPEAVEEILSRLVPHDVEFAVAGVPTAGTWDRIAVFVSGGATDAQLAEVRRRLATMKGPFRPHLVKVMETIPRGPSGKPLRRRLVRALTADD